MRHALALAIVAAALATAPPVASAADCKSGAVRELRAAAPDGTAVYDAIPDKTFFLTWIDCDDAQRALPTAVHESVHAITGDTDAFPLVGGGSLPRPHEVSAFAPPARIAKAFPPGDFVSTYLRPGRSSSATDVLYLLDELNAYTHELNAAVDLRHLASPDRPVDHRDGLAALMAFTAEYVENAKAREPATWAGLRQPRVAGTVAALWTQAERVMTSSCGIPDYGTQDVGYLRRACDPAAEAAVGQVIGRAPVCPIRCLAAPADARLEQPADGPPADRKGRRADARR